MPCCVPWCRNRFPHAGTKFKVIACSAQWLLCGQPGDRAVPVPRDPCCLESRSADYCPHLRTCSSCQNLCSSCLSGSSSSRLHRYFSVSSMLQQLEGWLQQLLLLLRS